MCVCLVPFISVYFCVSFLHLHQGCQPKLRAREWSDEEVLPSGPGMSEDPWMESG